MSRPTILLHNVRSILRNQFNLSVAAARFRPAIIALVETKSKPDRSLPSLVDYLPFSISASPTGAGGLAVYIHRLLAQQPRLEFSCHNCSTAVLALDIRLSRDLCCNFALVYRCPDPCSSACWPRMKEQLDKIASLSNPLFCGDFNAHHEDWSISAPSSRKSSDGNQLAEWMLQHNLVVLNSSFCPGAVTRPESNAVIDLFIARACARFINAVDIFNECPLSSDHLPLLASFGSSTSDFLHSAAPKHSTLRLREASDKDWQNYDEQLAAAAPALSDSLNVLLRDGDDNQRSIDLAHSELCSTILKAARLTIGEKEIRKRSSNGWFPPLRDLYRRYIAALKQLRKHPKNAAVAEHFRKLSSEWRDRAATAKQEQWQEFCSKISDGNTKVNWNRWHQSNSKPQSHLTSIVRQPGDPLPATLKASLNNLTAALATPQPHCSQPALDEQTVIDEYTAFVQRERAVDPSGLCFDEQLSSDQRDLNDHADISITEVTAQLAKRKSSTACGPDIVPPQLLTKAAATLAPLLAKLFSFSLRFAVVPRVCRQANVVALYKGKGSRSDAASYRPISITSTIARLFERVILARLTAYADAKSILSANQTGFRANGSTQQHLLRLAEDITSAMQKQVELPVVFLDLVKAFDCVWHDGLIVKLARCGFPFHLIRWVRAFLANRSIRAVHLDTEADWTLIAFGVPQGCVLSPFLFIVFLNDLFPSLDALRIVTLAFADDIAIYPNVKQFPSVSRKHDNTCSYRHLYTELQMALNAITDWAAQWKMKFAVKEDKSAMVVFSDRRDRNAIKSKELSLSGQTIPKQSQYKYLGVTMDERCSFKQHQHVMQQRLNSTAHAIERTIHGNRGPTPAVVGRLVASIMLPMLSYSLPYFQPTAAAEQKLNSTLLRPIRRALHLPANTPQALLRAEFGLPAVSQLRASMQHAMCYSFASLSATHPFLPTFKALAAERAKQKATKKLKRQSPLCAAANSKLKINTQKLAKKTLQQFKQQQQQQQRLQRQQQQISPRDRLLRLAEADDARQLIASFDRSDIVMYTDGACFGNPGPSGAGVVACFPATITTCAQQLEQFAATGNNGTNNVGELNAVRLALQLADGIAAPATIRICTDSEYVIAILTRRCGVRANGLLVDQLQKQLANVRQKGYAISFHHVRGHAGLEGNERADALACRGASFAASHSDCNIVADSSIARLTKSDRDTILDISDNVHGAAHISAADADVDTNNSNDDSDSETTSAAFFARLRDVSGNAARELCFNARRAASASTVAAANENGSLKGLLEPHHNKLPAYLRFDKEQHCRLRARLRLNVANLRNRTGRWGENALDPTARCCTHASCDNAIETREHVLLQCPRFEPPRGALALQLANLRSIGPLSLPVLLGACGARATKADTMKALALSGAFIVSICSVLHF